VAPGLAACAEAEVIITMLPTSREVDEIVDALIAAVRPGTLWIDATSGDPNVSRETGKRLAGHGVEFVDAPVTGAVVGAENATLTIMIGGSEQAFARARDILRLNGRTIIHVGPAGSGHAIKVLTNTIMGATVWITAECLLVARSYGIDVGTALAVTNAGSGRSNASENLLPMRLRDGHWPLVFKLAHHDKDIRIAATLAHQQHAAPPMLALTPHLFCGALNQLGDGADYIEVAKVIAAMNGTDWGNG
jgi:3-hydroxyisobutyrate dehydrogenase